MITLYCVFLAESWDCVATCFFIDTAHNVLEYVETIWKILKPGGVWINLGENLCSNSCYLLLFAF